MKYIRICLFLLSASLVGSCSNGTSTQVTLSSDPNIASFAFQAQDSFPGLSKGVFVIDNHLDADTGDIYTKDSLQYGTRISAVVPRITFSGSQVASAVFYTPCDTVSFLGTDTIDFSCTPVRISVISQDVKQEKWYRIRVDVHQVDPDLYVWRRSAEHIYPAEGAVQKLCRLGGQYCLYVGNGITTSLYRTADPADWHTALAPSGLPTTCRVRDLMQAGDSIYYADGTRLLASGDGLSFAPLFTATEFAFVNLLFRYNNLLWALVRATGEPQLRLASSPDGTSWTMQQDTLPADFPVSDYATVTFTSVSGRPRAMLMGGYTADGRALNTRWNVEYDGSRYRWADFSVEQPSFGALTGISLVRYNNRLLLFGGADDQGRVRDYTLMESVDEGMNWYVPDSAHNRMPDIYGARTEQSVVTDDNGNICIVGGRTRTEIFSDAYVGRLNSINW